LKPQSAKAKGRKLQNYVVSKIRGIFPELTERDVSSQPMGTPGPDIRLSEVAFKRLPYNFECKSKRRNSVYSDYDQILARLKQGEIPCLIVKADGRDPLAVVDLEVFLKLNAPKKDY